MTDKEDALTIRLLDRQFSRLASTGFLDLYLVRHADRCIGLFRSRSITA
jgi:hypothetical protein